MNRRKFLAGVGGATGLAFVPAAASGRDSRPNSPIREPGAHELQAAVSEAGRQGYNVKAYGAVGDGKADDAPAIGAALTAAAGRTVYLPPGSYRLGSGLTTVGNLVGVAGFSVLMPDPGVRAALTVGNESVKPRTSLVAGITINGTKNPSGTGLRLGYATRVASHLLVDRCEVLGFSGNGGVGIQFAECVNVVCQSCVSAANGVGVLFSTAGATPGVPTLSSWKNGTVQLCTTGIEVVYGRVLSFERVEISANHGYGVHVHPSPKGTAAPIHFDHCWIEANWLGKAANTYAVRVDGNAASSTSDITFTGVYYEGDLSGGGFLDADHATHIRLRDPYVNGGRPHMVRLAGANALLDVEQWNELPNTDFWKVVDFADGASPFANVNFAGGYGTGSLPRASLAPGAGLSLGSFSGVLLLMNPVTGASAQFMSDGGRISLVSAAGGSFAAVRGNPNTVNVYRDADRFIVENRTATPQVIERTVLGHLA